MKTFILHTMVQQAFLFLLDWLKMNASSLSFSSAMTAPLDPSPWVDYMGWSPASFLLVLGPPWNFLGQFPLEKQQIVFVQSKEFSNLWTMPPPLQSYLNENTGLSPHIYHSSLFNDTCHLCPTLVWCYTNSTMPSIMDICIKFFHHWRENVQLIISYSITQKAVNIN